MKIPLIVTRLFRSFFQLDHFPEYTSPWRDGLCPPAPVDRPKETYTRCIECNHPICESSIFRYCHDCSEDGKYYKPKK